MIILHSHTIKYLPFGMPGTVGESVTDATWLIKEETLQTYNRKALYMVIKLNGVIISSTRRAQE